MIDGIADYIVKFVVGMFAGAEVDSDYPKAVAIVKGLIIAIAAFFVATLSSLNAPDTVPMTSILILKFIALTLGGGVALGLCFIFLDWIFPK